MRGSVGEGVSASLEFVKAAPATQQIMEDTKDAPTDLVANAFLVMHTAAIERSTLALESIAASLKGLDDHFATYKDITW